MTKFKKLTAISMSMAFLAVGYGVVAQDDLDDLLKSLESDSATPAAAEEAPAAAVEEAPAPAEEAPAPAEEVPAVDEAESAPAEEAPAPAVDEAVSAPAEEASAPAAKSAADTDANKQEVLNMLDELSAEAAAAPAEEAAPVAPAEAAPAEAPAPATPVIDPANPDAELLMNIIEGETNRRKFMDNQAQREISAARRAMVDEDYADAIRHYYNAEKYLNDRPAQKKFRIECEMGVAEGLYRYAIQENRIGRRERAIKIMEKAVDMRHSKAKRQLEAWLFEDSQSNRRTNASKISHRQNDADYKQMRELQRTHLKRAAQMLATRELDKALVECDVVLREDPSNQEAIRLRSRIQDKRRVVLGQERAVARDGMMNDVDEKWRPVYAPNARMLEEVESKTVKTALGDDPERSAEQSIIKRMKEMRLPTVQFKPPATIIDAVDYFRQASKDYDRPDIPLEQRGFNFVLKTPEVLRSQAAAASDDDNDFGDTGDSGAAAATQQGVPVIPILTASDISFYDALKLVCDSVEHKFKVRGQIVTVMPKDMEIEEMVTRSYPVLSSFLTKMNAAKDEVKDLQAAGAFGRKAKRDDDGEENQERDWKEFFRMMGVEWPQGSTIFYMQTLGKLRVKNTRDNLVDFEDALNELNVDQRLIEIESRFVEVCQDDLNSLGFEWLLNSDYSLGLGKNLAKALGIRTDSGFDSSASTAGTYIGQSTTTTTGSGDPFETTGGGTTTSTTTTDIYSGGGSTKLPYTNGAKWIRDQNTLGKRSIGISAVDGTADGFSNGNRFLSTVGNHINGEAKMTNDRFMKVSAFLGNADLSMILHMLSQRSDTDLLSAPKVLTRPGEEAIIKVVTEYIYPTDYDVQLSSSSSGSSGSSYGGGRSSSVVAIVEPQSFTMREVGVILDVTPNLTDDGNLIDLELNTQVIDEPTWKNYGMRIPYSNNSSLASFEGIGGIFDGLANILNTFVGDIPKSLKSLISEKATDSAIAAMDSLAAQDGSMTYYDVPMEQPFFHVRSIDSKVSVYPGSTIVMGGLITEARKAMDDKIPFLGDIPIIGRLFRSHSELTSKRNLLIFVTTRLVDTRGREVTTQAGVKEEGEVKLADQAEN